MSDGEIPRPKVNINILIVKDGKILLGKRLGKNPGSNMYGSPGGHLEHLEAFQDCAHREISEETGMEIQHLRFLSVANVRMFPPAHYVALSFVADWKSGEPINKEPDKCEGWDWYDLNDLPSPRTPATNAAIQAYLKQGIVFDATQEHFQAEDIQLF